MVYGLKDVFAVVKTRWVQGIGESGQAQVRWPCAQLTNRLFVCLLRRVVSESANREYYIICWVSARWWSRTASSIPLMPWPDHTYGH